MIEPQMEQWVNQVHEFVMRPAFKHTVTTTYWKVNENMLVSVVWLKYFSEYIGDGYVAIFLPYPVQHSPCRRYFQVQDNRPFVHYPRCFHVRRSAWAPNTKWLNATVRCQSKSKILSHWTVPHFVMVYTVLDISTSFRPNTLCRTVPLRMVATRWRTHCTNRWSNVRRGFDRTSRSRWQTTIQWRTGKHSCRNCRGSVCTCDCNSRHRAPEGGATESETEKMESLMSFPVSMATIEWLQLPGQWNNRRRMQLEAPQPQRCQRRHLPFESWPHRLHRRQSPASRCLCLLSPNRPPRPFEWATHDSRWPPCMKCIDRGNHGANRNLTHISMWCRQRLTPRCFAYANVHRSRRCGDRCTLACSAKTRKRGNVMAPVRRIWIWN